MIIRVFMEDGALMTKTNFVKLNRAFMTWFDFTMCELSVPQI